MTIEVTSVTSISSRRSFPKMIRRFFRFAICPDRYSRRRLLLSVLALLLIVTLGTATITLIQSYRFYSGIIEARLASGYLTSRPGIYAAPRTISVGQKVTRDDLIQVLRRAGYTETKVSNVWSGSFKTEENAVEIYPNRVQEPGAGRHSICHRCPGPCGRSDRRRTCARTLYA